MFRRMLVICVLSVVAAGCSSSQPAQFDESVSAVPTPLATEPPAPSKAAPAPTSKATSSGVKSGSFYKPPGWDGVSDVNCSDFDTQAHAQSFFVGTGGSKTNDPYRLDNDHDGKACESLP